MTITASELYAIVGGITGEAWPDGVGYGKDFGWTMPFTDSDIACVPVEHAALMFTGSMVAWLSKRGTFCIDDMTADADGMDKPVVTSYADGTCKTWQGRTLLEALAAACREVGNG